MSRHLVVQAVSLLVVLIVASFISQAVSQTYVADFVATASFGVDMNDAGDIIGTSYPDPGCGSGCLPPLETVAWRNGTRMVLPVVSFSSYIYPVDINNQGWIAGSAGFPGTTTHAVVWKPVGNSYEAIDIGNLPGKTVSYATGIDEAGRVVGWSTTLNFPPSGAPFMWTEAGGMVDLSGMGFPNEAPLGISPGGTVATYNYWYNIADAGSVNALTTAPSGYLVENSKVAINDAGEQARFLVSLSGQNLVYPFRFHPGGGWQQISFSGTGHLSTYGMGTMNAAGDVTLTVQSTAQIAYGPDGLAQPIAPLLSASYGGGAVTAAGPINAEGEILARMIIGQTGQRLVRLLPGGPCTTGCIRVASIQMKGRGPAFCDQGNAFAKARVTVTDEAGNRLSGATVTAHFFDDYYLDQTVVGVTNNNGQASFTHSGPPCVGGIAILVTDVSASGKILDRTTGVLTNYVIPLPNSGAAISTLSDDETPALLSGAELPATFGLSQNYPNPFNPSTTITYQLPEDTHVTLVVSDLMGREVAVLVNEEQEAGYKSVVFDAANLASGVYFYRLEASGFVQTMKLMLMR
ncbi:MAG: T9SS type A sorting domain-containing protein [Ignavibacteria bacterium]|nr:T9SS type A sorting domain-containing protein [Ignavibacteria bacterium]